MNIGNEKNTIENTKTNAAKQRKKNQSMDSYSLTVCCDKLQRVWLYVCVCVQLWEYEK